MSGAPKDSGTAAKLGEEKKAAEETQKEQRTQQLALLEEDDEFEDFPVESMSADPTSPVLYRANQEPCAGRLDGGRESSTGWKCTFMGGGLGRR